MKNRFYVEKNTLILRDSDAGFSARELYHKRAISDPTFYTWRKKFSGMSVPAVERHNSPCKYPPKQAIYF